MLTFCPACNNIMTQREKKGNIGIYICRKCSAVKKIKARALEIKESVKYLAPPVPV